MKLECEGGECCEDGHTGDIIEVVVIDPKTGYNWGKFNYCENAIIEDIDRGLEVKKPSDFEES